MTEEILIVGGAVLGLIIVAYFYNEKRKRRRESIRRQVERIDLANRPGYRPPGDSMRTTIKDGVVTYRRDRRKKDDR